METSLWLVLSNMKRIFHLLKKVDISGHPLFNIATAEMSIQYTLYSKRNYTSVNNNYYNSFAYFVCYIYV